MGFSFEGDLRDVLHICRWQRAIAVHDGMPHAWGSRLHTAPTRLQVSHKFERTFLDVKPTINVPGPVVTSVNPLGDSAMSGNRQRSAEASAETSVVSSRGGHYDGERNARGEWEGFGRYTFTDGSVYEGQWLANQHDGLGTFWYESGNEYYGQWKVGKKHGKGTFGYAEGNVEVGTYVADQNEGAIRKWNKRESQRRRQ